MFALAGPEQALDPIEELALMRAYQAELSTDDRTLPPHIRALAGCSPEQVVTAMTDDLEKRGLPPGGVMLRWRRVPRTGSEVQGALALDDDGLPMLEGFTVVWHREQRRRLIDGTPIHGIPAAMLGLIELQSPSRSEAPPATISIAPSGEAGIDSRAPEMLTRAGRPLNRAVAPHFEEADLTLGALAKRMRNTLPDTGENRQILERLDRQMKRVLTPETRYDQITGVGFENIYDEITELPAIDHKGQPSRDAQGEKRTISLAYANHEFAALRSAMSYAVKEMSVEVDLSSRVIRKTRESAKEVEYRDLVSTRRLEQHGRAEAQVARTAVAAGKAPEVLVINGRLVPPPSQWPRIAQSVEIPGGSTEVDIRVAAMSGVALLRGAKGGPAYFATGLEALTLLLTYEAPRRGEIAALCRDCVDLKQARVTIKRSWLPKTKKMTGVGYTADEIQERTHDGKPRKLPLSEEVVNALERWIAELDQLSRGSGLTLPSSKSGSTVIFPTVTGRLIWPILGDLLGTLQERAGLASLPTHRSRHSLSTENKAMGVNEAETSRREGHTTSTDKLNYQQPNDAALELEADQAMAWRRMIDKGASKKEVLGRMRQL